MHAKITFTSQTLGLRFPLLLCFCKWEKPKEPHRGRAEEEPMKPVVQIKPEALELLSGKATHYTTTPS